jgi:hypothetical protein
MLGEGSGTGYSNTEVLMQLVAGLDRKTEKWGKTDLLVELLRTVPFASAPLCTWSTL